LSRKTGQLRFDPFSRKSKAIGGKKRRVRSLQKKEAAFSGRAAFGKIRMTFRLGK
jgi:hypothetical protein